MRRNKTVILLAGTAAVLGAAWLIKRRSEASAAPKSWRRILAQRYGAEKGGWLIEEIQREYESLLASRPVPGSALLRWHLTKNILPGLALYRVLQAEHGGDQQAVLAEVDELFRAWTMDDRLGVFAAPMRTLPMPFGLFRQFMMAAMKIYPAEGWDFEYVENSDERVAFNARRCYYFNTLTDLGAPELTASFCKTDDVMAEAFPNSVRFVRPHTLGRGDTLCDFQYCRVKRAE